MKKIRTIFILITLVLAIFLSNAIVYGKNGMPITEVIEEEQSLDNTGYLLIIEDGRYGHLKIKPDIKFNKSRIWGQLIDENNNLYMIDGDATGNSEQTIKYEGKIKNKDNYRFEAYIYRKQNESSFKGHINILEVDESNKILSASTYIIDSFNGNKEIKIKRDVESKVKIPLEESIKVTNILGDEEYYQHQDTIDGYGYAVQVYYPTGSSENQNHLFRFQTIEDDAFEWVREEYPDYEPDYVTGGDVKLYHQAYSGTVWNNISPTSSKKEFTVTVSYGYLSVDIPVVFQSVNIYNDGRYNLYYTTTNTDDWNDPYPICCKIKIPKVAS